jgi:hypothetical protein
MKSRVDCTGRPCTPVMGSSALASLPRSVSAALQRKGAVLPKDRSGS